MTGPKHSALKKLTNFYYQMVALATLLLGQGYRMAAHMREQPPAAVLDLRRVVQHVTGKLNRGHYYMGHIL